MKQHLSSEDRHRAQLIGVAAAYFPDQPALRHTLVTAVELLDESEDVLAAVLAFRGYRPRTGVLLITSEALLWVKQSFLRRHARAVKVPFDAIAWNHCFERHRSRLQLDTYQLGLDGAEVRGEWFSIDQEDAASFAGACRALKRLLADKVELELPPVRSNDTESRGEVS